MTTHSNPAWQAQMAIRLDFNYMLDRMIGAERGLSLDAVKGLQTEINRVHDLIQGRNGAGADFLGFLDLPYQDKAAIDRVQATADRLAALGDIHLVLGIGGSYLGARAILEALFSPYRNELPRTVRKGRPRMYFEGNNLDADAMQALFDLLPGKPGDAGDATLNVISKSGGTIETAVAFRLFRQKFEAVYGQKEAAKRIVATTDIAKGNLKRLADQEGYDTFEVPDNVGGRYSILTPVGLLPAAIAGVDIHALVAGARAIAERCKSAALLDDGTAAGNPAYMYAALMHLSYKAGRNVSIMAAWAKRLEFVGFWYDQLCAESLGKEQGGRIPFSSVNSRDLHARGQQVQEGPFNTVVTNLVVGRSARPLTIANDSQDIDALNYVAGWDMDIMQRGAMEGTRFAYAKDGRPSLNLEIPEVNAYTLGQLFYLFELATLAEGYLQRINPLDQPGVEAYKKFMFGNLGRADMATFKAEFDARTPPLAEFVI